MCRIGIAIGLAFHRCTRAVSAVLSTVFGSGNSGITYTLGEEAESASISHGEINIGRATPQISIVENAVTVTGYSLGGMVVSGAGTSGANGVYDFTGNEYGGGIYEKGLYSLIRTAAIGVGRYALKHSYTTVLYQGPVDSSTNPSGVSFSVVDALAAAPSVASCPSTASQVIAALGWTEGVDALLTFTLAPGSDGSGAISTHAAVTLHT